MPPLLPPTSERLERHGLYLIDDGQTMFLWVGRDAVPQLVMDVFNLPSYDQLRGGKVLFGIFVYLDSRLFGYTAFLIDDFTASRKSIFAARERYRREDPRDAAWTLLFAPIRRQRGWRTTASPLGS